MTAIPSDYAPALNFYRQSDGAWLAQPTVQFADYGWQPFAARSLDRLKRDLRAEVTDPIRYETVSKTHIIVHVKEPE